MADEVIRRQGSAADHGSFTGANGEWTHDTTLKAIRVHDGAQAGGYPIFHEGYVESAPDGGTDAFSADARRPISAAETVRADFTSANTTTTPTFENTQGTPSGALTITTRDGSALWSGALSGVHELQLNAGGTAWLVLDPNPVSANSANAGVQRDANGRAKFADPSADADAATKGWALAAPGTSIDPGLAFDTWRTPNADRSTRVLISVQATTDGNATGIIDGRVDEAGGTTATYTFRIATASSVAPSGFEAFLTVSFDVPAGHSYQISNAADPQAANQIRTHREFTL